MNVFLDFEKPIADLEGKIEELRQLGTKDGAKDGAKSAGINIDEEILRLHNKVAGLIGDTYAKLTPWQKTQVARHPSRPHFFDYVGRLMTDFTPLAGDRLFGDDKAIVAGPEARFRGRSVAVMGHEKGTDTRSRLEHNFGMALPEGYRKVQRLFEMADRFALPGLSLVDTPGAYPGIGAEERGQGGSDCAGHASLPRGAHALHRHHHRRGWLWRCGGDCHGEQGFDVAAFDLFGDFPPEGCASILWRKADKAADAAAAMKITAQDLLELKVIDGIIAEPIGGAHRAPQEAMDAAGNTIEEALRELEQFGPDDLKRMRREKFLQIGQISRAGAA